VRDAFVRRLAQIAERYPRVLLITGDLGFGVLTDFAKRFPGQYLNAGVAEQNMAGLATGLALDGRIVFTYSIGNFPTLRCLEQIRNGACYHEANVKIVAVGGGFSYGALGMTHHATEDVAILRALPRMKVLVPGDDWEAAEATEAMVHTPGPCYLRLDKSKAPATRREGETYRLGVIRELREGRDFTLVCYGGILGSVLQAADTLRAEGVSCRVLNVHTVKPIDREALVRAARETGGILTIEEHTVEGGLGGVVAETLLEAAAAPRRFLRLGLRDQFSSIVGSQEYLRKRYGLDQEAIVARVHEVLNQ
jgi:transketolase